MKVERVPFINIMHPWFTHCDKVLESLIFLYILNAGKYSSRMKQLGNHICITPWKILTASWHTMAQNHKICQVKWRIFTALRYFLKGEGETFTTWNRKENPRRGRARREESKHSPKLSRGQHQIRINVSMSAILFYRASNVWFLAVLSLSWFCHMNVVMITICATVQEAWNWVLILPLNILPSFAPSLLIAHRAVHGAIWRVIIDMSVSFGTEPLSRSMSRRRWGTYTMGC